MATLKNLCLTFLFVLTTAIGMSQTIVLPNLASNALRSTAEDVANLLNRATANQHYTVVTATASNAAFILIYDTTITNNQTCKVQHLNNQLVFSAAEDNGLIFGLYQYLHQLGFKFYQPGTIWEVIPSLSQTILTRDTTYSSAFVYKTWFISGGYQAWKMDNQTQYFWESYGGENGHQWAQYQRRNGMLGANRFNGHRGDLMGGDYLQTLRDNPCYVANYNGSRTANVQSVPDVNNAQAMQSWSEAIRKQYAQYTQIVGNNPTIYPDLSHSLKYNYQHVGIEVPDGALWANTAGGNCNGGNLLSESDQQFTLANNTATSLLQQFAGKRFQVYAYDAHANTPAASIGVHPALDVQVVPTAFQFETSSKSLLKRWYTASSHVSEYHYLNIPQWSGETPSFHLSTLKQTLQRLTEQRSQGIVWEAGVSKFATLPYLLAANNQLLYQQPVDQTLSNFCTDMFGNAAPAVLQLLKEWSSESLVTLDQGIQDNKFKLPYYLQLLQQADGLAANSDAVVKARINELKAFVHYMVLYYNWVNDQRAVEQKQQAAATLCAYLAAINERKIVNSYFLIMDIVNRYPANSEIYTKYHPQTGSFYDNGRLPQLTPQEIESLHQQDLRLLQTGIRYQFSDFNTVLSQLTAHHLQPMEKVQVKIGYTHGKNYTQRSEYFVYVPNDAPMGINFTAQYQQQGKGHLNITVENEQQALGVITDFTAALSQTTGNLTIHFPQAGFYKISVTTKFQTNVALTFTTNGNYLYKKDGFWGNTIENYREQLANFPGYVYVPAGIQQLYFSLNNANPGGAGFATETAIDQAFAFRDEQGNALLSAFAGTADSALMRLTIRNNTNGTFIYASKMEQYRLTLTNTNNWYWYVQPTDCQQSKVKATVASQNGNCTVTLQSATATELQWEVYNAGNWIKLNAAKEITLPENISPNAIITTRSQTGCVTRQRLLDIDGYRTGLNNCLGNSSLPIVENKNITLYPNPSTGIFYFAQQNQPVVADQVQVFNASGKLVVATVKAGKIDISRSPAGIYFYKLVSNNQSQNGRIVKL